MNNHNRYNTKALIALMGASSIVAMAATTVLANPLDPKIVIGNVSVTGLGTADVTIGNNSLRSIVDWKKFSIGSGETTTINQISKDAAILNRVISDNPSEIFGHLTSNGQVYLVNEHGILVGASGVVDTNGFVASTLDISNTSFLGAGEMLFKQGVKVGGGITVEGTIRSVSGGDIFLLSREITIGEKGVISSNGGYVGLGAGEEILLKPTDSGDGRISIRAGQGRIINRGRIEATVAELRAAGGNEYALAINNTGVVRATGFSRNGGRVMLTGGGTVRNSGHIHATKTVFIHSTRRIENAGTIQATNTITRKGGTIVLNAPEISIEKGSFLDVSAALGGGRVLLGGGTQGGKAVSADGDVVVMTNAKSVTVDTGAIFNASATESGNAGDITVWSDGTTNFAGSIIATAAAGKGGNAEVSGAHLTYNGSANLVGSAGFGTLLLDPGQVNITHEVAGTNTASTTDTFFDDTLATALATANVTIATSAATAANGATEDIVFGSGVIIAWNKATTLGLLAGHDIIATKSLSIQNTQTGDGVTTFVQTNVGGVVFLAGNNITIGSTATVGSTTIGSEFGQNIFVAGVAAGSLNLASLPAILAPATAAANVTNAGSVTVTGGNTSGALAQLGYGQYEKRGNNTGNDFSAAGVRAANGDISVIAGQDVTVISGGNAVASTSNSYAQIGHGGVNQNSAALALFNAPVSAAEIVGNITVVAGINVFGNVTVTNAAGANASDYAQIGHGSLLGSNGGATPVAVAQGDISGNISVKALHDGNINVGTSFASSITSCCEVFVAQIGHGGHLAYLGAGLAGVEASTGRIQGDISVASLKADGITASTTGIVQIGNASVSALAGDDRYFIDNKIGHGGHIYLNYNSAMVSGDSSLDATQGAIQTFNPLGATSGGLTTNIKVDAGQVLLYANEATQNSAPYSGFALDNLVHSQIGSGGQTVSLTSTAAAAAASVNVINSAANIAGLGLFDSVGALLNTLADLNAALQAGTFKLSPTPAAAANGQLTSGQATALGAAINAATTLGSVPVSAPTASVGAPMNVSLKEGNITGNITVTARGTAADGILLDSEITAGLTAITKDVMVTRIGHGSQAYLNTAAGGVLADGTAGVNGGLIRYEQANILQSAIIAQTTNAASSITIKTNVAAGLAPVINSSTVAAIGSGGEALFLTGAGGDGNINVRASGFGGDIIFSKGTVYDYAETSTALDPETGYDTSIQVISAKDINVLSSQSAALAAIIANDSISRIGHGSFIRLTTGAGGSSSTGVFGAGTNGGRGGDIVMVQQTPDRDVEGAAAVAEDQAWGLRGQISLQANDPGKTAITVKSSVSAALSTAMNASSSSQIGHGDFISATSGAGGAGGKPQASDFTAWGGRGGNVDIDLSNMLIESNIVSSDNSGLTNNLGITGALLVDASTTNALLPSQHNWSDSSIGHGEAVSVLTGKGGAGGSADPALIGGLAYLSNIVTVQKSETDLEAYMEGAIVKSNRGVGVQFTAGLAGEGAARGGNGGDVQVRLGTVTNTIETAADVTNHLGKANILLNLRNTDAAGVSLTVNAQINTGLSDGNGDDVVATVGARNKVLAVSGIGGNGGNGAASNDPFLKNAGTFTVAVTPVPVQNNTSGGRGGDVMITAGKGVIVSATDVLGNQEILAQVANSNAGAVVSANPAASADYVKGDIVIKADGQVKVTTNNLMGGYSQTNATIGHVSDLVAVTQKGGNAGMLFGDGTVLESSDAQSGIATSAQAGNIQIIHNYDGTSGVSVLKNGNADTITTVAAERGNGTAPAVVKNAIFYDKNGNPELILNAAGILVANDPLDLNNTTNRVLAANITLFGRTVASYDGGVANANVQYVQLNFGQAGLAPVAASGRPDLVAAVAGGALTVVDLNHDGKYDMISGRIRLADGNLAAFSLMDETQVTGFTPTVAGNALSWTNPVQINGTLSTANFSTADGGRGGNAGTHSGTTTGDIVVQAQLAGDPMAKGYSIVVNSNVIGSAVPGSPGYDVSQARIGDYNYQISDTGGYAKNRLNGSTFNVAGAALVSTAAIGGDAAENAVNGLGGNGGNATLQQGGDTGLGTISTGNIYLNADTSGNALVNFKQADGITSQATYVGGGVQVKAFDDNDLNFNVSVAQVGHGAFAVSGSGDQGANAGNTPLNMGATGGAGQTDSGEAGPNSIITVYANGGKGGSSTIDQGDLSGAIKVYGGGNMNGDFAVDVSAIKGPSSVPGDSNDTIVAQIGMGRIATGGAGKGGTLTDGGAYQASGGNGGSATVSQSALLSSSILVDTDTYAGQNKTDGRGHGVSIDAQVNQGANHIIRGQIGTGDIAFATGGAGGDSDPKVNFTQTMYETANGGDAGFATIRQGLLSGTGNYINTAVTVKAAQAKTGLNGVSVTTSDNTVNVGDQHHVLAEIGDGSYGFAKTTIGGNAGLTGAVGSGIGLPLTTSANNEFYQGVDVAAVNPANLATGTLVLANLDTNPITYGTVRNGGAGGNATVATGNIGTFGTSVDISVTANTYTGDKNGILLQVTTGLGNNTDRLIDGNVAMIGHSQFDRADATAALGGDAPNAGLASAITQGNGGSGGSGTTTIGQIAGNITVANIHDISLGNLGTGKGDISLKVLNNASDVAKQQGQALIGSRSFGEAYGGKGGLSSTPAPQAYPATISSMGGNGGNATVIQQAVLGNIAVTAEGSIVIDLEAGKATSTLVGQIGHDINAKAIAADGNFGGDTDAFNGYAIWNALARYVAMGSNINNLSSYDQQLALPVLSYFGGTLPASFVQQILGGNKATFTAAAGATPASYGLGRDDNNVNSSATVGANNFAVPTLSADELKTLKAIAAAAGRGGNAVITQGTLIQPVAAGPIYQIGTSGSITLLANALDGKSTVKGINIIANAGLSSGAEIARVGHEMEIRQATGGVGPDVRDYSTGIGGNGGNVNVSQFDIKALPGFYGQDILLKTALNDGSTTLGDIYVKSSIATDSSYARAYVGHRQVIGDDNPNYRTDPVLMAGNGGSDNKVHNEGYLGNGGSVTSYQGGIAGDVNLQTTGKGAFATNITILADQVNSGTEALTMIGSQVLLASAKSGDAGFYSPLRFVDGLYGVSLANGGAVTITQGDFTATGNGIAIASTENILAFGDILVKSSTAAAGGMANLLIGNDQVVADTRWGKKNGFVKGGNGGNTIVEDAEPATGAQAAALANGAPNQTDTVHATPAADGNGGNVNILLGTEGVGQNAGDVAVANIISSNGTIGNTGLTTGILSNANVGPATTYLGQLRTVTATTGEGAVQGGTLPRTPGQGGTATIERGAVTGEVLVTTQDVGNLGTTEVRVDATSANGAVAKTLLGHTVDYNITTGRSGYGLEVFLGTNLVGTYSANGSASVSTSLNVSLLAFGGQPLSTANVAGQATTRDALNAIHDMENVVAVLRAANRYSNRYAAADATVLANALTNATNALAAANTAMGVGGTGITGVQTAATASEAALTAARNMVVGPVGSANQIAAQADGGNINYTTSLLTSAGSPNLPAATGTNIMANEGLVSGNVILSAAPNGYAARGIYGVGIVAVTAEGGNGTSALTELGHRYSITDVTGIGGGLNEASGHDGGVAGNGGSITVTQTTIGNATLNANTVVVHSLSGTGAADIHLLANVQMTNTTGEADIVDNLGQGGNIIATQSSTGSAFINANYLSSSDAATGQANADRKILADGAPGASHVRIGVEATSNNYTNSDLSAVDTPRPADSNRGGMIVANQMVQADASGKTFALNLNLAGDTHITDLKIMSSGLNSDVNIGNIAAQTAISGVEGGTTAVSNGWDVTATQNVSGDISIPKIDDLLITNDGAGVAGLHIGHSAYQDAESGKIDINGYFGGVVTASQTATGAIGLSAYRSATIQSGGAATDTMQIGHNVKQIAKAADRRLGTAYPNYPAAGIVTTAPAGIILASGAASNALNVIATQSTGGDLSLTAAEIKIENQDGIGIVAPTSNAQLGWAKVAGVEFGHAAERIVDTMNNGIGSSVSVITGTTSLTSTNPLATLPTADTTLVTVLKGDITVNSSKAGGKVQVGDTSNSTVSHAAPPVTGTFFTVQAIGDYTLNYTLTANGRVQNTAANAINITAFNDLKVTTAAASTSQIGHYITEEGTPLHAAGAVKDASAIQQTVGSNINVNVGNNLLMQIAAGGTAQIGHISPETNEWQLNVAKTAAITQQILDGNITVEVGTNKAGTINGNATAGGDDALLDGSAGGNVRIGHDIATGTNQTDVAAGDIWLRVMADLKIDTAAVGHSEYQHSTTSGTINAKTAIANLGTVRNRIWGDTTIGAGQLTPGLNANATAGVMTLKAAEINSGYGQDQGQAKTDVNGHLRFFIPSRLNLVTLAGNVFNDSTAATAIPVRPSQDNHVDGDIFIKNGGKNQENGFQLMSTTATYVNNGDANYAFYFAEPKSSAPGYSPYINFFDENDGFNISSVNGDGSSGQGPLNSGILDNADYLGTNSGQVACQELGGTTRDDGQCSVSTETHFQSEENGFGSSAGFGGNAGGNGGGSHGPINHGPINFGQFASLSLVNPPAILQPVQQVAVTKIPVFSPTVVQVAGVNVGPDDIVIASKLPTPAYSPLESLGIPVVISYAAASDIEINQLKRLYRPVWAFASTYGNGLKGL